MIKDKIKEAKSDIKVKYFEDGKIYVVFCNVRLAEVTQADSGNTNCVPIYRVEEYIRHLRRQYVKDTVDYYNNKI